MTPGQDSLRGRFSNEWMLENPVLPHGQIGVELDGGRMKYGDGSTVWINLAYLDSPYARTTDIAKVDGNIQAVSTQVTELQNQTTAQASTISAQAGLITTLQSQVAALNAKVNPIP